MSITPEKVHAVRDILRMGCTCGVVTSDDSKAWDRAQEVLPELVADIEALLSADLIRTLQQELAYLRVEGRDIGGIVGVLKLLGVQDSE